MSLTTSIVVVGVTAIIAFGPRPVDPRSI
jgi:hypothetical protein